MGRNRENAPRVVTPARRHGCAQGHEHKQFLILYCLRSHPVHILPREARRDGLGI